MLYNYKITHVTEMINIIDQIAKTSFGGQFQSKHLDDLHKLIALADDRLIEKASKMVQDAEEDYQQKVQDFAQQQAKDSVEELHGVLRDIQKERLGANRRREQKLRKSEKSLLSNLEDQLNNT